MDKVYIFQRINKGLENSDGEFIRVFRTKKDLKKALVSYIEEYLKYDYLGGSESLEALLNDYNTFQDSLGSGKGRHNLFIFHREIE